MSEEEKIKESVSLATLARDIHYIQKGMDEMKNEVTESIKGLRDDLAEKYVTKDAFEPVRKLVYGTAGVVLSTVLSAIVWLVIKR